MKTKKDTNTIKMARGLWVLFKYSMITPLMRFRYTGYVTENPFIESSFENGRQSGLWTLKDESGKIREQTIFI